MRRVMVRYRVKPEAAARNEELVRAVFAELARERPEGLRYACYVLEDGVSFVHVAEGDVRLPDFPAFRAFLEDHAERCEEPPVVTALREVGSFGGSSPEASVR
jgi:hypothetical protein